MCLSPVDFGRGGSGLETLQKTLIPIILRGRGRTCPILLIKARTLKHKQPRNEAGDKTSIVGHRHRSSFADWSQRTFWKDNPHLSHVKSIEDRARGKAVLFGRSGGGSLCVRWLQSFTFPEGVHSRTRGRLGCVAVIVTRRFVAVLTSQTQLVLVRVCIC